MLLYTTHSQRCSYGWVPEYADQLTLFKPGRGADYAPNTIAPPRFKKLSAPFALNFKKTINLFVVTLELLKKSFKVHRFYPENQSAKNR